MADSETGLRPFMRNSTRPRVQGEQVYNTPAHNALASQVIINQLMPLLPKDSEEVNLQVYQLTIEATGGDSYIVANSLPICLSSSARTWLMGLPRGLVCSWSDLC
jgi:hypothetical protein